MAYQVTFTMNSLYTGTTEADSFTIIGKHVNGSPSDTIIATNISKANLIEGVTYQVLDTITGGTVTSTGVCTNSTIWLGLNSDGSGDTPPPDDLPSDDLPSDDGLGEGDGAGEPLRASAFASMEPCIGGTIDDHMGVVVSLTAPVTVKTDFDVTVYYKFLNSNCNSSNITIGANTETFIVTILADRDNGYVDACSQGRYIPDGANICGACITNHDNPSDTITFTNPDGCIT